VRVFRFVLAKVKDNSVADDVVAETFLEVWRNAKRFEARASVSTWLLAIARHKAFSALRSYRAHDDIDEEVSLEDTADSPYITAETTDRNEVVRQCLAKLSASHREILNLVYYQEEPIESVAKIVGIPLNTVKTRMFYARKQLAGLLQKAGIDHTAI
jgi:RNA polymerase sigma-70 factor, ECF subfamily